MKARFRTMAHWTDEEIIQHLYGVGPENASDAHIQECEACMSRLQAMQASRNFVEEQAGTEAGVSLEELAAQRRAIYAKLERRNNWWGMVPLRRWAAAACTIAVLTAGVMTWEYRADWDGQSQAAEQRAKVTDAQLADDVSRAASNIEPDAAAPLQALFQD